MPVSLGISLSNIIITVLAVVLSISIAIYSVLHRKVIGAIYMVLIALFGTSWGVLYLLELLSRTIEYKNFYDSMEYIPAIFLPSAFLLFCHVYTNRSEKRRNPAWLLTLVFPVITILIILTNPYHQLFKKIEETLAVKAVYLEPLFPQYGVWFWVVVGYSILMLLAAMIYLVRKYQKAPRLSRVGIGAVLFGIGLPVVGSILSIPFWANQMGANIILVFLTAFLLILSWSLFGNRMLDVIPLARSTLISQMSDAVITLDPHGAIVDSNSAALMIPQLNLADHIGESFPILLNSQLKTHFPIESCLDRSMEVVFGEGADTRIYDMSLSALTTDANESIGSLVVLREITKRKQEEIERVMIEERYRAIFDNSNYGILILNHQGMIVEHNAQASQISGYTSQQILFRYLGDFIQDIPELKSTDPNEQKHILEVSLVHTSGDLIPIELSIVPISHGGENIYYVSFQDIRERKRSESITRSAMENVQYRNEELAILRNVTESLNQATTLRSAIIPVLETVTAITKSLHVWLFLLGKSDHSYQRIEYHPLDEDNLLVVDNLQGKLPGCLEKLMEGRIETPRTVKDCLCSTLTSNPNHYSLPLYIGKQPFGILNFLSDKEVQLNENKVKLLHTICDSLAVAIERVRLFKSEHDQRKLAETMRDIGTTLTTSLDLNEILDLLLDQLSRLVPYDGGNVILIDGNNAQIARYRGYESVGKKKASTLLNLSLSIEDVENLHTIFKTRKPLVIQDTGKYSGWRENEISPYYHAWLGVPVIIEGEVEAIFCLDKIEAGFYTHDHAKLVSLFAAQSSLAIKNAYLFAAEAKRIKELDVLRATLTDISSQLDVNVLLKEIAKRAIHLLNSDIGEIGLYEPEKAALRILVSENMPADFTGKLIKVGEGVMGKVAQTRQPLVITDYVAQTGELKEDKSKPYLGLAVPLLGGNNEFLGVIGVGNENRRRVFNENDIRLLNLFAQQATIALRNAQLFADARQRAEEAETLREAGAVVVSSLNQSEAIQLILEQLRQVVPYDSASVLLQKKGSLQILGGQGYLETKPLSGREISLDRKNPVAAVYLDNQPRLIRTVLKEIPTVSEHAEHKQIIRSWLGVPLTIHNQPIGILSLDAQKPDQFTEEHARLVTAFADQVAIALENSRLYEQAIQAANRNETMYKLSQTISANIRSDEIYSAIHQATTKLMDTEFFCISLINEKEQSIEDKYIFDGKDPVELSSRPLGQGLFGRVIAEGKSVLYNAFDESMIASTGAVLTGNDQREDISQSIMVVPLKIGPKAIGVLSAQSYQPNAYTESDLEMLELLGANAAIALENARLFSEVQELAITDPVTGLYNRRKFLELAEQEFNRSIRYEHHLSAIMLDIDNFKVVNDTYGHSVGDKVLIQLADVCQGAIRQVDFLARWGGEEFMVLLPETDVNEAAVIAERLRSRTEAYQFKTTMAEIKITISLGVAELEKTCTNLNELLDRADFAQYSSKAYGKNRVTNWSPSIAQRSKETGILQLR